MNHPPRRLAIGLVSLLLLPVLAFTVLRTQPKPIVQVSPPVGATDVWLGISVQVTFGMPMDRNSVETHFSVDPPATGTFVWRFDERGETVEFRPDDILVATTTYHVTLKAGLRDAEGNVVLDTDYTWSFATRQAYDVIDFGYGLPVQLVDPNGRNRVQVSPGYSRIRVDFALYALPAPDFAVRYKDLDPGQDAPIDVGGLTQVAAWQEHFIDDESYTVPETTLPAVPSGIYVIVAGHPDAGQDEMFVVVSRHVLALKQGVDNEVMAWATRLQDQTPTANMTITLYDDEGVSIDSGQTDSDGVVKLDAGNRTPLLAIGQVGDEITLAGLDGAWRTSSGYWYWWWDQSRADDYRVYLYTDRPIYRPGHTVHFAAILRHDQDGKYAPVEASQPATVTLRDSRNNVVGSQVVLTDDFGAVDGDFTLATEPPMGTYYVELENDGETHRQALRVEAYRKPEYKVDVTTPVSYAVAGDDVPVTIEAEYFFGQPVGGAEVVLKIYRQISYWYWWESEGGEQIAELRGTTDAAGQWGTTFSTDGALGQDAVYTFAATVTDASRQPVEGRHAVSVYWNTFRLTLTTDKYGYRKGEPVVAQISARTHDNMPVANKSITVTVDRGYYRETEIVAREEVTTDEQGQAQVSFTNLEVGWYRMTAEAFDERGRQVESARYVWIYDPSASNWWYSSDDELSVTADRDNYAPGDTAQLLIQSRVTGIALLTLERGSVYHEQVVNIDGPATTVAIPIEEDFVPNIFARVHIFKPGTDESNYYGNIPEGRLLTAQVELPVSAESHRLAVSVTPGADQYLPGDQAQFTLEVRDASGARVDALVGLVLVDEAIFALSEDLSADIFTSFYGQRSNTVSLFDSLAPQRYFWYRGISEDGIIRGTATPSPTGTPAPTAPAPEDQGQGLRQEFRDTAYWNPGIRTRSDGPIVVTVDLPDNLTTWRVIARAVTLDTKVGDETTSILVTQDIIARPALPRFTVLGDRFALDTITQNFSGQDVAGTASLDAPHLVVLDPGTRSLDLPNTGTGVARWTAVAAEVGQGTITCTVDTPAGSDAIELPLETKPFTVPERWSAAGQVTLEVTERFDVPFNAVHEATQLTLRLSPSVALGVLDGLDALIDYPYGCVEQTMSRVLPSAVAARTYRELGIPNPKAGELPEIIHQGVQRLYGFQHQDGGWGWWYDDEGGVYMTAYVLFGLTMVQEAGFEVDSSVLDRGFTFLDGRLPGVDDPRITAYALYVKSVAGRGDLSAARALLPVHDTLDPFARAALAMTLEAEGDPEAAQMLVDKLIAEAVETPTTAHWLPKEPIWTQYYWRTMSSTEKNTAMALRALAELRSGHRLLPKAVRWLMDHRRDAGWRDTQATAFAILGLTDYIQVSGELQAEYEYTVTLNDQQIANGRVTPETATEPIEPIIISGTDLRDGENKLHIEREGQGQLYYTLALRLALFYDGFEPVSSIDQGLAINRTYRLLEGTGQSTSQANGYNVGDLVEVGLTLDVRDELWYVVVEDPLPAGFEALNERMNPVAYGDDFPFWRWYEWGYNRKDIYDDKVAFFATQLWPGTHRFTYLMRATTPGEFSALPAQAYPMYKEEIWGRSASHLVRVAPETLTDRPALAGDFDRDCRVTAFDARQVAGAWGTTTRARDLNGDNYVNLWDITAVAGRRGASCLSDLAIPGTGGGRAVFEVKPRVGSISVGDAFDVDVILKGTADPSAGSGQALGGFGLTLTFDPDQLRVAGVTLSAGAADTLRLGPRIDNKSGRVAFGAFGNPSDLAGGKLATVTFVGQRIGRAAVGVAGVEAVDGQMRVVEAGATVTGQTTVGGVTRFFPLLRR